MVAVDSTNAVVCHLVGLSALELTGVESGGKLDPLGDPRGRQAVDVLRQLCVFMADILLEDPGLRTGRESTLCEKVLEDANVLATTLSV